MGIVVIVIVGAFAALMLWLSRSKDDALSTFYTIYFRKFSLAGLQINSGVTMRGIKVGTVEALQISPKDIELVKVTIRVQKETPIKTDTEAVVERNLLTGLSSIDLTHSSKAAALLAHTPGDEYPVIPEGRATLAAIQDTLPQIFERTRELVTKLDTLASPQNLEAFTTTLANLKSVSATLADRKDAIAASLDNLSNVTKSAEDLLRTLNLQSQALSGALSKTSNELAVEASHATHSLSTTADAVSSTLEQYQDPQGLLRGHASSAYGPGEEAQQ